MKNARLKNTDGHLTFRENIPAKLPLPYSILLHPWC